MSFRREKCEIQRRGIWLVNRFWDYVNSGAKGCWANQVRDLVAGWVRWNLIPRSGKRSRLQGDRRFGMGSGASKPAPFQKPKGCGTQLPSKDFQWWRVKPALRITPKGASLGPAYRWRSHG